MALATYEGDSCCVPTTSTRGAAHEPPQHLQPLRIRPGRPPVDLAELDLEEAAARELERLHIDIRAAA
jgi:hypothetical protein